MTNTTTTTQKIAALYQEMENELATVKDLPYWERKAQREWIRQEYALRAVALRKGGR